MMFSAPNSLIIFPDGGKSVCFAPDCHWRTPFRGRIAVFAPTIAIDDYHSGAE